MVVDSLETRTIFCPSILCCWVMRAATVWSRVGGRCVRVGVGGNGGDGWGCRDGEDMISHRLCSPNGGQYIHCYDRGGSCGSGGGGSGRWVAGMRCGRGGVGHQFLWGWISCLWMQCMPTLLHTDHKWFKRLVLSTNKRADVCYLSFMRSASKFDILVIRERPRIQMSRTGLEGWD